MAARASKCKACGARTTSHTGFCQWCKSRRHRGYDRVRDEHLVVDQAGGAWWIWDARGDVLVAGKPTRDAAIIALGAGDVEDGGELAVEETAGARMRGSATAEVARLREDARLWWRIAKAESKARFGGSLDAMERAIAAEKKLVALGETPPRRPKGFEDHHAVRANPADKLAEHGIVTLGDLDRWIAERPQVVEKGPYAGQREFMSRYQALKQIVGEGAAIEMLNNLAIDQCTPPPKARRGKARR